MTRNFDIYFINYQVLQLDEQMKSLAQTLQNVRNLFIIGRGFQFATCLEAALKIKEIAYIHSEVYHKLPIFLSLSNDLNSVDDVCIFGGSE
jgi:hypothetical protein